MRCLKLDAVSAKHLVQLSEIASTVRKLDISKWYCENAEKNVDEAKYDKMLRSFITKCHRITELNVPCPQTWMLTAGDVSLLEELRILRVQLNSRCDTSDLRFRSVTELYIVIPVIMVAGAVELINSCEAR